MCAKVSMKALNLPIPMNVTAAVAEKVLEFDKEFLGAQYIPCNT
jgi:hypothetical protein